MINFRDFGGTVVQVLINKVFLLTLHCFVAIGLKKKTNRRTNNMFCNYLREVVTLIGYQYQLASLRCYST